MIQKVKIRDIATFVRGVSYKKDQAQKEYSEGYTAILRANNISAGSILMDDLVYVPNTLISDDQIVNKGDIVITMSSGSKAHVGKVAIATETMNCAFGAFCGKLVCIGVLPSYLFYLLMSKRFRSHIESQCKGTNINNIKQGYILDYEIVLPARTEQERIVTRIEELFSELDNGVETLRKTKQQLAVYRQAVLKDAFSHITEKKTIREMSSVVTSGSRGWAQYYSDHGAKFVRIGNLTRDRIRIDLSDIQFVDLPDGAEGKRTQLQPNDVLVSITADLGSIGLVHDDIGEAYVNQHIAMIRFLNPVQGEFMAWYLRSDYGQKDLLKNKRGGGKLGLGLDDIRDSRVPVVSDAEAIRIVENIEARLSVCDSIEKTVDTALQQAESMRQSILKQAFEGRLN